MRKSPRTKKIVQRASQVVVTSHELFTKQLERSVIEALTMLPSGERERFGSRVQSSLEEAQVEHGSPDECLAMASILASLAEIEMRSFLPSPTSRQEMLATAEREPLYAFYGCIYTHSVLWLKNQVERLPS